GRGQPGGQATDVALRTEVESLPDQAVPAVHPHAPGTVDEDVGDERVLEQSLELPAAEQLGAGAGVEVEQPPPAVRGAGGRHGGGHGRGVGPRGPLREARPELGDRGHAPSPTRARTLRPAARGGPRRWSPCDWQRPTPPARARSGRGTAASGSRHAWATSSGRRVPAAGPRSTRWAGRSASATAAAAAAAAARVSDPVTRTTVS